MVSFAERHVSQAYPVVLAFGCLAGLGWLVARRTSTTGGKDETLEAALAGLALGLIGARAGFVALHLPYFRRHPAEALWIWEGGLSWVGGAIGAILAVTAWARLRKANLPALADGVALPAALIALAAWIGCFLDRCMVGIPVNPSPMALPAADLFGTVAPRWPSAGVGMIGAGILAAGVFLLQDRRLPPGLLAATVLSGLAALGLILSFTRADPSLLLLGLRLDSIGALGVLGVGIAAGVHSWARARRG